MGAKRPAGGIVRFRSILTLSVLVLAFWAGTARADKRVALVVGNSQYTRITPKLANPANDANDIAQALKSIGFEVILKIDAGKGEFDRGLAEFARKASGADTALFYYAGHGLQYQGKNFFLPIDIDVQDVADVEFQAVGINSVQQAIDRSGGVKIIILDACRDNPLAKEFATRGLNGGGGGTRGLARIDRTEGFIIAYATAPDQVAQDGTGRRNSPFTEALIHRIKEPGLEIGTMFRRVTSDVYETTRGRQRPEVSISLLTDYFLIPAESDTIAWDRIRDSNDEADFKEFIQKFPSSPFTREAQARIDLFERIRRENAEEARLKREREALEAEKCDSDRTKLKELTATLQADAIQSLAKESACPTIKLDAEKALQQVARALDERKKHDAELEKQRLAAACDSDTVKLKQLTDALQTDAIQRLAKESTCPTIKPSIDNALQQVARVVEEHKKHDADLERQRIAEACDRDSTKLKELTGALQADAIQTLGKETTCPTLKPAIGAALKEVERGVKRTCDADRKTLAAVKNNDIESLKGAVDHMTCETVRAGAQQRLAKLEDEVKQKEQLCAEEKQKLNAIDENVASARQQYVEFQSHAACATLRAEVTGTIKKIDERVKAAQIELTRLGCYNASINGQFDEATRKSLALYHSKKGSQEGGDHLNDGLVSELRSQELGLCPSEPNVAAKPPASSPETPAPNTQQATHEQNVEPGHNASATPGGTRKERVSRPGRSHRNVVAEREQELVPPPSQHRSHHRIVPDEEPVTMPKHRHASRPPAIARAPSMPPRPAAEAPASSSAHITGVGF
jgi:Caspase domain